MNRFYVEKNDFLIGESCQKYIVADSMKNFLPETRLIC